MWTLQNTEGFTQEQLDVINDIIERLMENNEDLEVNAVNAAINNEWRDGISKDELYAATAKRLGLPA